MKYILISLLLITLLSGCNSKQIRAERTFPLYEKQLEDAIKEEQWESVNYLLQHPTTPLPLDYYRYLVKYHHLTKTTPQLLKKYQKKPETFERQYVLALIYSLKGIYHIPRAITLFEDAEKKLTPEITGHSELYYNLALMLQQRERYQEAMKRIDQALKADKRSKYQLLKAYLHVQQEQYLQAQQLLNKNFDRLKKGHEIQKGRKLMEHLLKERKNLPPKVKESYYNLLGFLETGKHSNDIIKFGKQGIIDFPSLSVYYTLLALGYYMEDRRSDAVRYFEKAIMIDPSDPFNYIHQGILYNNLKQYHKAKEYFNKALKLNRYLPSAYNYLSKIELLHKNYSKAIIFKQAELKMVENLEIYLDLELLLRKGERLEEAKALAERLIKNYPDEPKPYKRLVLIYELMLDEVEKPKKRKALIKEINRITKVFREKEGDAASKRLEKLKEDGI